MHACTKLVLTVLVNSSHTDGTEAFNYGHWLCAKQLSRDDITATDILAALNE